MNAISRTLGRLVLLSASVGCVTDAVVPLAYAPVGDSPIATAVGDATIVVDVRDARRLAPTWVIGTMRDGMGRESAHVLASGAPAAAVREAFTAELTRVGYRVVGPDDGAAEPGARTVVITLRDLWTDHGQASTGALVAVVDTEVRLRQATGDEVHIDVVGRAAIGTPGWDPIGDVSNAAIADWSRTVVRVPELRAFLAASARSAALDAR